MSPTLVLGTGQLQIDTKHVHTAPGKYLGLHIGNNPVTTIP